ncbi:hypothetical protein DUNSADRAFT_1635 [Dunaliella salina]|uniref:Uncharacterized protein n=1 Tax=Dunaliella salina TaxID=3046 RepID=A0ABQ7GWW5_DUNSA|nr:hypothetical protein DUNSADRAFT_1635 [Dunaliella salina]|eukprot:KAF5839090.1 hypothetical protein DUNSADRAFT_1635 [Dunaliella salina]
MLEAIVEQQSSQDGPSELSLATYDAAEGQYCTLDLALPDNLTFCAHGLVCVPQRQQSTPGGEPASSVYPPGVCAQPILGVLLPEAFPPRFPVPLAYFPLSTPGLASYPDGAYRSQDFRASLTADTRFGQVLQCDQTKASGAPQFVRLDPVPYAANGSFAINLFAKMRQKDLQSSLFSYLFSHVGANETDMDMGPNKVHLFVPGQTSAFYGISVRSILRDRVDKDLGRPSQVWLDTSGHIGNDQPGRFLEDGVEVDDGEWHMVTLTTLSGQARSSLEVVPSTLPAVAATALPAGYALYLDGTLRAVLKPGVKRSTANESDAAVQVTGGAPADLDGPITLCGRSDLSVERFFSGQLSNLMLFDTALTEDEVAELYSSYSQQSIQYPVGEISAATNQELLEGGRCAMPFSLGGRLHYKPVFLQGFLSCPSQDNNKWLPAAKPAALPNEDLNLTAYGVADGASLGPIIRALPRVTTSGQMCMLRPSEQANGSTYADCVQEGDREVCQVAGGFMQECAPVITLNKSSTNCVKPGIRQARKAGVSRGTKEFVTCVSIKGQEFCQTESQSWIQCPEASLQRKTVTGVPCRIPFEFNGMVHSDCIIDVKQQFAAVCPVADDSQGLVECQPADAPPSLKPRLTMRFTFDRQRCLPPGPGALSECLNYDSEVPKCETASGALMACAPVFRVGVFGAPCQLPFSYRGWNRTNCVDVDGVEACKTMDGDWQQCAGLYATSFPKPPANATGRYTVTGKTCALPFEYRGKPAWDCVGGGISSKPAFCTTVDGEWQQCAALVKNISRVTATGDHCVLPFESGGVRYHDCIGANPATGSPGFCMNRAGRLEMCGPRPERYTTTGKRCRFPQRWAGMNVSDCVAGPLSQKKVPACPTGTAGQWEACAPLYTRPVVEPNGIADIPQPASAASISKPQSEGSFARSQSGGPASSSPTRTDSSRQRKPSNRKRDLILGLTLGLGGGILVLAIALGALRRSWAKRYHARVMKEMRMAPEGTTGLGVP